MTPKLSNSNKKLGKNVVSFSLHTDSCLAFLDKKCKGCYAVKIERRWQTCSNAWKHNLEASKLDSFVPFMIALLQVELLKGKNVCRVHVAGDFYSREYADKWRDIAKALPDMTFYAYTKHPDVCLHLNKLDNFIVHNSIALDGGLNYGDHDRIAELTQLGYTVCPDTLTKGYGHRCMNTCKKCLDKSFRPCFLKH